MLNKGKKRIKLKESCCMCLYVANKYILLLMGISFLIERFSYSLIVILFPSPATPLLKDIEPINLQIIFISTSKSSPSSERERERDWQGGEWLLQGYRDHRYPSEGKDPPA